MGRTLSLEYIAGFFDGEGCITTINQHKGRKYLLVSVSQKSRHVLDVIQETVGGTVQGPYGPSSMYCLRWQGVTARIFLEKVVPHLICKLPQAALVLSQPEGPLTQEVVVELRRLKGEL
jgi:hypothetical protein